MRPGERNKTATQDCQEIVPDVSRVIDTRPGRSFLLPCIQTDLREVLVGHPDTLFGQFVGELPLILTVEKEDPLGLLCRCRQRCQQNEENEHHQCEETQHGYPTESIMILKGNYQ